MRNYLNFREKIDFVAIDIVYEPTLDDTREIDCYFVPDISLAFHAKDDKFRKGQKYFNTQKVRQCYYCNNYFVKTFEELQKHISCCSGKVGFEFSFDNGKLIDYQDHYSNLGDVPFSVYYEFETFFDEKMYVVSYCMIIAFHPLIKLRRISILKVLIKMKMIFNLSHIFKLLNTTFFNTEKEYFNRTALKQLQQAAYSLSQKEYFTCRNVQNRIKIYC